MSNPQYLTAQQFQNATSGANYKDLPAGELDNYLQRASAAISEFCGRAFGPQASVTESLFSNDAGRVRIANGGWLSLYPEQAYPIVSISALTWKVRALPLSFGNSNVAIQTSTLTSSDWFLDTDRRGDGYRVRVFRGFSPYRDPTTIVQFDLTYTGGYANYPVWLQEACVRWCAHLLKKRGAQGWVLNGDGVAMDPGQSTGDLRAAQDILKPHVRVF